MVPWIGLQSLIVAFPGSTYLLHNTVKPVLSSHSNIDKTLQDAPWAILLACIKRLSVMRAYFGLLLSGHLRQVLLYNIYIIN